MEDTLARFNGYLSAIRRLTRNKLFLSARWIPESDDPEVAARNLIRESYEQALFNPMIEIDGSKSTELIWSKIIAATAVDEDIRKFLEWDIGEQFGLIAFDLGSEQYHPHLEGAKLIEYKQDSGGRLGTCLMVRIQKKLLVLDIIEAAN